MARSTYFFQECPTCGRTLQIRVDYLGKFVVCQHCYGKFEASDPENDSFSITESAILRRANELLKSLPTEANYPSANYPSANYPTEATS